MATDSNGGNGLPSQEKVARGFNGVWIPASLWRRKDLTWFQKCLLAEISSFEECFASNGYLAELMCSTKKNISNEISALRKKGLILDWGWDGERRFLMVAREVHPNPHGDPIHPQVDTLSSCRWTRVTSGGSRRLEEGLKKTSEVSDVPVFSDFEARTKEQKRKFLRHPRFPIPTCLEVEDYCQDNELDYLLSTGRYETAYDTLLKNKWHHWNAKTNMWRMVKDWKAFFTALNDKMNDAF